MQKEELKPWQTNPQTGKPWGEEQTPTEELKPAGPQMREPLGRAESAPAAEELKPWQINPATGKPWPGSAKPSAPEEDPKPLQTTPGSVGRWGEAVARQATPGERSINSDQAEALKSNPMPLLNRDEGPETNDKQRDILPVRQLWGNKSASSVWQTPQSRQSSPEEPKTGQSSPAKEAQGSGGGDAQERPQQQPHTGQQEATGRATDTGGPASGSGLTAAVPRARPQLNAEGPFADEEDNVTTCSVDAVLKICEEAKAGSDEADKCRQIARALPPGAATESMRTSANQGLDGGSDEYDSVVPMFSFNSTDYEVDGADALEVTVLLLAPSLPSLPLVAPLAGWQGGAHGSPEKEKTALADREHACVDRGGSCRRRRRQQHGLHDHRR